MDARDARDAADAAEGGRLGIATAGDDGDDWDAIDIICGGIATTAGVAECVAIAIVILPIRRKGRRESMVSSRPLA